ncbi:LacI family DNA-binding transcriptional regulator [Breznakiella homolactica]|uniref:LacI family DNA-binding transcriptional regulator n=1 Tax=Breznakiella homolactica TaxID=2798577 RepID=UPI001CBA6282|nr:LacI family DNA-binding transcriptional regulator [Breznakiella homolactica]
MKNDRKKSTYQEIAAEAEVSIATVSRILTGASKVKPETRDKVLEIMARHGYDTADLQMVKQPQTSGIIIFNIPSLGNPFYSQIASGAKAAARRHGFQLLVNEEHINSNTIATLTGLIQKVNAAGIITTNHVPTPLLRKLYDTLPLVQCCEFDNELEIPYVSIDDIAATKATMEYLISLGRRRIAFVNGPMRYKYARQRLKGYTESLEKAGMAQDPALVIQLPDVSYDMAVSAVGQLLASPQKPDAFFCISDVYAAAVVKSCARSGINVPRDMMVTGFDNLDIASMVNPAITTVNQPKYQLGFSSCELLVDLINNPQTGVRRILLETELIVRESTSPLIS